MHKHAMKRVPLRLKTLLHNTPCELHHGCIGLLQCKRVDAGSAGGNMGMSFWMLLLGRGASGSWWRRARDARVMKPCCAQVAMGSMPLYAALPAVTEAVVEAGWTRVYSRPSVGACDERIASQVAHHGALPVKIHVSVWMDTHTVTRHVCRKHFVLLEK